MLTLEMTKLGLKEVMWLAQSLTAGKGWSLDLLSGLSLPQTLPILLCGIPGILSPSYFTLFQSSILPKCTNLLRAPQLQKSLEDGPLDDF